MLCALRTFGRPSDWLYQQTAWNESVAILTGLKRLWSLTFFPIYIVHFYECSFPASSVSNSVNWICSTVGFFKKKNVNVKTTAIGREDCKGLWEQGGLCRCWTLLLPSKSCSGSRVFPKFPRVLAAFCILVWLKEALGRLLSTHLSIILEAFW